MRTEIGKITSARVGYGGYQDAMIGVSWGLGGPGWGVGDFWGAWATHHDYCKWTVADQTVLLGEVFLRLRDVLKDAKVETVDQLVGKPIEVTWDRNALKSWRVLTEAI